MGASLGARPFTVVIVGGGFSGVVAAIQLLDAAAGRPLRVRIVEPRPDVGLGLAFSTTDPVHYLNGPARLFSVHPDRPDHLVDWIVVQGVAGQVPLPASGRLADAYVPRRLYGAYVRSELARAEAQAGINGFVEHLRAEAVDLLEDEAGGVRVALSDGRTVRGDIALLATGFSGNRPGFPVSPAAVASGRYFADPWTLSASDAGQSLPPSGTVLFVGGGLTMLDALATLERQGFAGRYLSLSRHGLLVHERREPPAGREFIDDDALPVTARALLVLVKRELAALAAEGGDWQAVVPVVRARLGRLWEGANAAERARFNRHLRRYWELALHRAPGPSHETFLKVQAAGRLATRAARIEAIDADNASLLVRLRPRGAGAEGAVEDLRVDLVVNTTGAEYAWPRIAGRPLVTALLGRGTVRPGGLGYGIDADADAAVIGADGAVSARIFGIGPILRGTRWESTTIVEIVAQASAFGALVAERHLALRPAAAAPADPHASAA